MTATPPDFTAARRVMAGLRRQAIAKIAALDGLEFLRPEMAELEAAAHVLGIAHDGIRAIDAAAADEAAPALTRRKASV